MSIHLLLLALSVFLAAAVEVVEMVTIVLGVGVIRGWPSTLFGAGVGLVVLIAIVAILGPLLTRFMPIDVLRATVGILLLLFGLQWLRKSTIRISRSGFASGEEEEEGEAEQDKGDSVVSRVDWTSFVLAFKGVLLEGLEIAFIVVALGTSMNRLGLASAAAAAAFVVITAVAAAARGYLQKLPANTIKFAVGLLLLSYGTFWAAKGAGVAWPGSDLAILGLLALYACYGFAAIGLLRHVDTAEAG